MKLREKVVLWMVSSLVAVLAAVGVVNYVMSSHITDEETGRSAKLVATNITEAMASFGEIGDMDGLESFLGRVEAQGSISGVRAVRGPTVVEEYGSREGSQPLDELHARVLATGEPEHVIDRGAHTIRYVMPVHAVESCIDCHDQSAQGDVLGLGDVVISTAAAAAAVTRQSTTMALALLMAVVVEALFLWIIISRKVIKPVQEASYTLLNRAQSITTSADTFADSATQMAQGANDQAASVEETSASIKEIASSNRENAASADNANQLSHKATAAVEGSRGAMDRMGHAMSAIKESTSETSRIIKAIDEIAFQTNLLALNAAVEAARAGEAGKGFAVVAEEVRDLAAGSAKAARSTAELIEKALRNAEEGAQVTQEVNGIMVEITTDIGESTNAIGEVSSAVEKQSGDIDQINSAVGRIEGITQSNAATAEQTASASEELSAMANDLRLVASGLVDLVGSDN